MSKQHGCAASDKMQGDAAAKALRSLVRRQTLDQFTSQHLQQIVSRDVRSASVEV